MESGRSDDAVVSLRPRPVESQLQRTEKGAIIPCISNLDLLLSSDHAISGKIQRDDFSHRIVSAIDSIPVGPWTDEHTYWLTAFLERKYSMRIRTSLVHEAVCLVAGKNKAPHPVAQYLESLHWDGIDRISRVWESYLGAKYTLYSHVAAMNFFISAVARVCNPGAKVDTATILFGKQGVGKSSFFQILGGVWHGEGFYELGSRDSALALRGKWIVELSELASLTKSTLEKIKQFITTPADSYRDPYGRSIRDYPRQCVFTGTTNNREILGDPTGNRRLIPIECGDGWQLDRDALQRDRDQLWAEAVYHYRSGDSWWEWPTEELLAEQERYSSILADPWVGPIRTYIAGRSSVTVSSILGNCLEIPIKDQGGRREHRRVAEILQSIGWKCAIVKEDGVRVRSYVP